MALVLKANVGDSIDIRHAGEKLTITFEDNGKVAIEAPVSFSVLRSNAGRKEPRENRD